MNRPSGKRIGPYGVTAVIAGDGIGRSTGLRDYGQFQKEAIFRRHPHPLENLA